MRNPVFDTVLFDLDGTLLDTEEAILKSIQYTVAHFTGEYKPTESYKKFLGLPLIDVFSQLVPEHPEEACRVYVDHNLMIHPQMVKGFPGARDILLRLRESGVRLGLVTSKRRKSAEVGLELAHISGLFQVLVCHGETSRAKPDPEPVLRALQLMGLFQGKTEGPPSDRVKCENYELNGCIKANALLVGDSPFDIRAAKNASRVLEKSSSGIVLKSAAVTYGAYSREVLEMEKPDFIIDSIWQVLSICEIT